MEVNQNDMNNEDLRRYASLGVEVECEPHLAALQRVYSFFPELRKKHAKLLLNGAQKGLPSPQVAVDAATTSALPKKRTMSAEARRRISENMKKRWAERKGKRKVGRPRKSPPTVPATPA